MGKLLVGGRLYTYAQGTTAFKAAYADTAGTVPQTYTADGLGGQYIALNARGELPAPLFLSTGSYDIALKRPDGSTVWSRPATGVEDVTIGVIAQILAFIANVADGAGSSLVGFIQAGVGAVLRSVQSKLREHVTFEDFGAVGDGVADDTTAIERAIASLRTNGAAHPTPGRKYRFTRPLLMTSVHLHCAGKAELIADLNDPTKDALTLSATIVRTGTAQQYVPACCLTGVTVLVRSALRDGIRLAYGDYPVWNRVDVQRDPTTSPTWRDGVHIEAEGTGKFIENLCFTAVRVHDAGRSGFRFEVPATGVNVFINVGTYENCEVRGSGLNFAASCVDFVSNNLVATEKISSHKFVGGEYANNSAAPSLNPDGFKATVAAGAPLVENVHVDTATSECIPTAGTGFAFNTAGFIRTVLTNYLPYGYTGAPTGVGGTGEFPIVIGYLGVNRGQFSGTWTPVFQGSSSAGAPVVEFSGGTYAMMGGLCLVTFHAKVTSWGGAAGTMILNGLPAKIRNHAFHQPVGTLSILNGPTLGAGYNTAVLRGIYNTTAMVLRKTGAGGVLSAEVDISTITGTLEISGAMTYEMAPG